MLTKEEKKAKLRVLYHKVVEEIDMLTDSMAKDVRIEQVIYDNENNIKDCVVSYLLKNFNHVEDLVGTWSGVTPAYERIYKKINLNTENEISGLLLYDMA
jgi:hypothetical protein